MTVNAHTVVAILQTIAYVPIVPLGIFILARNWAYRPRKAWYPFVLFSCMRLAGGPIVIVLESKGGPFNTGNIGLVIAALVLLNVGLIPMIVATLGQLQILLQERTTADKSNLTRIPELTRLALSIAAVLLCAGSSLSSSARLASLGKTLTEAGYVVFAVILLALVSVELYMWREVSRLSRFAQKSLKFASLAIPFLLVRAVYGLGYIFNSGDITSIWNPLFGNAVMFALMGLLTEYVIVGLYMWVGLSLARRTVVTNESQRNAEGI
ncbi:hypothetical protein BX600DRAFT_470276 [Xylariales sp. PMI_506]|nr:hypothetical protein BX600DRAFT_470276 [Xylariales sp. PMI_506]